MQIKPFQQKNTGIRALMGAAILAGAGTPQKALCEKPKALSPAIQNISLLSNPNESHLTKGMPKTFYYEHGQQISKFEERELWEISNKYCEDSTLKPRYQTPLPLSENPYITKDGLYGAPRGILPHLGVDISVNNPKASTIPVVSPVDGIIVGNSRPTRKAGTHQTKVMGEDGRIFVMEYFSNLRDSLIRKSTKLNHPGTPLKIGDTIGFVSREPKKDVFNLHFAVEDLDVMAAQENDSTWKSMQKFFNWKIEGNVNPLDSTKTGGLARQLNKMRIEAGKILPFIKKLDDVK